MNTISAVVLTKNEEEMLPDCLQSLAFCTEIVLIDSGSTDQTVQIAKTYGAKVFEDLSMDFSQKRNLGASKAKGDWIIYVDADERVSETLQKSLKELLEQKNTKDAYSIERINYYLGKNRWPKSEHFLRCIKKKSLLEWRGELHETAIVKGESGALSGELLHFTHRTLESMVAKTIHWSGIEAQLRFDADHPKMSWWRFPRVMLTAFYTSYIKQEGWKVGTVGIIESIYQSFSIFLTYARLWELQQGKRSV